MSTFAAVRATFETNWTTVLVGWNGLGVLSPWPERWVEFPPLLTADEVAAFCEERIASSSDPAEQDLIVAALSADLLTENREEIKRLLTPLSASYKGDPGIEIRKWRVVLLEKTLAHMPKDALYGLMALTEFWQSFGFPSDCPHEVQGLRNAVSPFEYYQHGNLDRLIDRHRVWIENEKVALQKL